MEGAVSRIVVVLLWISGGSLGGLITLMQYNPKDPEWKSDMLKMAVIWILFNAVCFLWFRGHNRELRKAKEIDDMLEERKKSAR